MWLCNCGHERDDGIQPCPHCGSEVYAYLPSEEDIALACAEIQSSWTAADEAARRRKSGYADDEVEIPAVSLLKLYPGKRPGRREP